MPDARVYLVSEVASVGLSSSFRRRIGAPRFRELPFYGLAATAESVARAARAGDGWALADATAQLGQRLASVRHAMAAVHAHLDQSGVSTRIVYQLERMSAQVRRAELLLGRIAGAGGATATAAAIARLVRDTVDSTRILDLVERNSRLLARKVVDRSAEAGTHYIARNRREYFAMVRSAAGGGLVTSVTAWLKLGISLLKAPPGVEGILASVNYAASFVVLQLAHFTATSRRLGAAFGRARAARVARWLRENVSGLAGNVSLGFLLGMTPALGHAFGLPLDVRHVTLSAGFLAASTAAVGPSALHSSPFWWAVGGLASMAVLNVGVSFGLALATAVRAQGLQAPERSQLQAALWSRFRRRPADLVVPANASAS